jgi:hypothetical protein
LFTAFPWTEELTVGAVPLLDREISPDATMLGLIMPMKNRETKHTKGAHNWMILVLIVERKAEYHQRVGIAMLDIKEAPVYLDADGAVLAHGPSLLQTPYWKRSLWFKNSSKQTIYLM